MMAEVAEARRHFRYLVCDGDQDAVRDIRVALENAGHLVRTAHTGKNALLKLENGGFDFLLLDVMLPDVDGFEVLQEIRRDAKFDSLVIVMLTAKHQDREVFESYRQGVDLYLVKPLNPADVPGLFRP